MDNQLADLIEAISLRPDELSLRLDLADFLQKRRKFELARWMRGSLVRWSGFANIKCTFPTLTVCGSMGGSYDGLNRVLCSPKWEAVCPPYWRPPGLCSYGEYYGRLVISCEAVSQSSDRSCVNELASMVWLEKLQKDGLLELVEYGLGSSETAAWALDLPHEIQSLPFFLNTARSSRGLTKDVSRRLLSWPSLIGLYFTTGVFSKGIFAELPRLAKGLQFLTIEASRRSAELDELFQGIPSFPDLRLVFVLAESQLPKENLESLSQSTSITTLWFPSWKLNRDGLFLLGETANLRWLGINSGLLTRQDIVDFRTRFRNVHLFLGEDMQLRLGPA
jgi:hypothetical protein